MHGRGYTLFLTSTEAILSLSQKGRKGEAAKWAKGGVEDISQGASSPQTLDSSLTLRMQLVGANPNPQVAGVEELPGKVNYFRGNDPQKWRTNIPTYGKVKYENVYPGIDLAFYGNQRQLEYDFIVTPGADPKAIRLGFDGLVGAQFAAPKIDTNGDLILQIEGGEVRLHKPSVYQEINGARREIAGRYMLSQPGTPNFQTPNSEPREVGFEVAAYDTNKPLIIDPVLSYSTYLGGSGEDVGRSVAVDSLGSVYVTGLTSSPDFATVHALQGTSHGNYDVFVTKLDATNTALVYSTYLGGDALDFGYDIAIDSSGNAYVTGQTCSSDFPTMNPLQATSGGGCDASVTKVNPAGTGMVYSTYLGGSSTDAGSGIAVDSSSNVYVTGGGSSGGFPPALVTLLQASGGTFVVKLNAAGSAPLLYEEFFGGEAGISIAVDPSGYAYVTGSSHGGIQPTLEAFQQNFGGAFVIKINLDGSDVVYSSYLGGGSGDEVGYGIAADTAGNAYVTGLTQSSNFPITPGVFQTTKNAIRTVFVTKVNPTGTAMVYSTYLGGSGQPPGEGDYGMDITVDAQGNAYITGRTTSQDFPLRDSFQTSYGGGLADAYIVKLKPDGSDLVYSSYLGGNGEDSTIGLARDRYDNVYVTGYTSSANFPTVNPFQVSYGGGAHDAFVAKISENEAPVAVPGTDQAVNEKAPVTLDGSGSYDPNGDPLTYTWIQIAGPPVQLNLTDPVHPSFVAPDVPVGGATCSFKLIVGEGKVQSEPVVVNITIKHVNHAPVACICPAEQHVQEGSLVLLDGTKSYDPDGDSLTFKWVQTAGPQVTLADSTNAQTSFTAPLTGRAGATLTFVLTVADGTAQGTATATVVVENINHAPTANAGDDQTKNEGSLVTLDGTTSDDPDQDILTYTWSQISGPAVVLSDPHSPIPTFTAPSVGHGGAALVFRLVVNDDLANSAPDTVTITVLDINDPPACALAQASPDLLWPPNHKLLAVGITGVADPNDDTVTLAITGATQDEPVNGLGDGDTSPDAVIQGDSVLLRAERAGTGNGRVYKVSFIADDGFGGRCTGSIKVCVPHDRQSNVCVDDGQRYDSTRP